MTDVDPIGAMFNDALWPQFLHMWIATFAVTGFLVAAVYAVGMLRGRRDRSHRLGFTVPFVFAAIAALCQPLVGHWAGSRLDTQQPSKLAAMELATETETNAPVVIGGVLIDGEVRGGVEIPKLASLLAGNSFDTEIIGFDQIPDDEEPPANVVHFVVPDDDRRRHRDDRRGDLVGLEATSPRRHRCRVRLAMVPPSGGRRGPTRGGGPGGGVDDDRGREAAVDRLPRDAGRRGGHDELGNLDQPRRHGDRVREHDGRGRTVLLGMARRWREDQSLDLPTPYGPSAELARSGHAR